MNQENLKLADMMVQLLSESKAWIHMGDDNMPVVYLNDGDDRYRVKKVQVFDETTQKLATKWVNLGVAPKKEYPDVDPNVLQSILKKLQA